MILLNINAAAQERVDPTPIRVLYAGDIELARPQFASSARQLTLTPITDVIGAFGGRGAAAGVDAAVIDCGAPGVNAPQVVSQLRALRLAIPIVLLIDPGVENGAAMALSLGSDDYTVKTPGWLGRLPVRLQIVISRHRRLQQLELTGALEQRMKAAIERAPVCLARILDDGSVAAINDAARSMLAVDSLAEVLKKPLAAFVAPGHHEVLAEFISTICRGEARSVELPIVPKQGDERIMELRGVALPPDAADRPSVIVALRDLSEHRRLEASVLEVSAGDKPAETGGEATFSAEIAELRQRLADAEVERQHLVHDCDAERQTATAATAETARLSALLAERESSAPGVGEAEPADHDARERAGQMVRALEQERQQAAAAAHQAATALEEERQLREAIELRLDLEEQRRFADAVARDAESKRIAELSRECEELRAALERQTRSAAADHDAHRVHIQDLERRLADDAGAAEALRERCNALDAERQRLCVDAEQSMNYLAAQAQANDAHAAEIAATRAALAAAVEERDTSRTLLEAERYKPAAAMPTGPSHHDVMREQAIAIESLTAQLRAAEAASERATAGPVDQDPADRAGEAEVLQAIEYRRSHRQELLAALNDAQHFEDLAARHLARCSELERCLSAMKTEFDELTAWATVRAARAAEALS